MAQLRVDGGTSLQDLRQFANSVGNDKVRGKQNNDGSITLYSSNKTGTGLKNFLFGTSSKRQAKGQEAIANIFFNIPRPQGLGALALGVGLANVQQQLPHGELHGAQLRNILDGAEHEVENSQRTELRGSVPQRQDLPVGMNVNAHGVITGQAQLNTTALGVNIVPIDQALTQTATGFINSTQNVGGVHICSKANDDMCRMNLNIPNYGLTMGPPGGDGTPQYEQKKQENAQALRQFAGSDNATKVLSSCCTQYMLRRFEGALENGQGDKLALTLASRGNSKDFTHIDQHGTATDVGKPSQYAAADFQLGTYPNGDFKITISWDLYATGFKNAIPPSVPQVIMPDNHVMKTTVQSEMRIDKNQADLGNLVLTLPHPPTLTFDGTI